MSLKSPFLNRKHRNYKDGISSCGKRGGEIVLLVLHNSHFDIFMQKSGSPCPLRVGYWARVLTLASHTVLATKGRVLPHTALQRIVRRGSESQQFIPFTNRKSRD